MGMNLGVWQVAVLYCFAALGGSYLTGFEWLHSFAFYGSWGMIGVAFATAGTAWMAYRASMLVYDQRLSSLGQFSRALLGKTWGSTLHAVLFIVYVALSGMFLAMQARVVTNVLELPLVMALGLLLGTLYYLSRASFAIQARMVLVFLSICLTLFVFLLSRQLYLPISPLTYQMNGWWLWHALLFVGLHGLYVLMVFLPIVRSVPSRKKVQQGIWLGTALFTVFVFLMQVLLVTRWHDIHQSKIPFYQVIAAELPYASIIFALLFSLYLLLSISLWLRSLTLPLILTRGWNEQPVMFLFLILLILASLFPLVVGSYSILLHRIATMLGLGVLIALLLPFKNKQSP